MHRQAFLLVWLLLAASPAHATDWPQLQGGPQRQGCTPDSPKPPYGVLWNHYFADDDEKVYAQCQPVVYKDRVYVGTKMGHFYCFEAQTGKIAWKWKGAKGPILNTAACGEGKVVFSCLDGCVRALDAAGGQPAWEFDGGMHGFNTAPCLAGGKVFIGSREGVFYCLDLASGKPVWQHDMGAYIFCTAAWNEGRVFFGTEDLVFHCLDAATGQDVWKSPRLFGTTFKDLYPVVHSGKVVARTQSNVDAFRVPVDLKDIESATRQNRFLDVPPETSDLFQKQLKENPLHQSYFVFDEKTGAVPFIACHNRGGTNGGVAAPPCVDAAGNWYVALSAKGYTGLIFASINPSDGRFGKFIWRSDHKRSNPDEQENFSVGGDRLFVAEQEEGDVGLHAVYDLKTAEMHKLEPSMGWMEGLGYDAEEAGGHAFAISGDRFYHISFQNLTCRQGPLQEPCQGKRRQKP